jgi:hypothetical protein
MFINTIKQRSITRAAPSTISKGFENLQALVSFANSAGSSSVTQPVSTAFMRFRLLPIPCGGVRKHIQSRFGHMGMTSFFKKR